MIYENIKSLYEFYYKYLTDECMPFWLKNAIDKEYGGYLTCLDRMGKVYGTDKSVWFQGRGLWTFSRLYNSIEKKDEWLAAAKSGFDFLEKHCFDSDGRMYFSVTREGKPIQKRRYYFSETFAIMGYAEYARASSDYSALERAKKIFTMVMDLYRNPWKLPSKYFPETRPLKSLSNPMIILSTTQLLRDIEDLPEYNNVIDELLEEIFKHFMKPEHEALFENVGSNGECLLDLPQGRCINPGHSIETTWFLLTEGIYRNDSIVIKKALDILDWSLELGWDKEYGGLLYFVDIEKKPVPQLEWDMKLWWPHTEALYALLLANHVTGNEAYLKKFKTVHQWSFEHFSDREYGEWFGYLHRDGSVSNTLKGSMWKGPFHLPRALILIVKLLEKMTQQQQILFDNLN